MVSARLAASVACLAAASIALAMPVPAAPVQAAAPAPGQARVKPATRDDLDFRPGALTLVTDEATGQRFLVFTYVVANKTGKSQRFAPRFELLMGDGTILSGGKDVPVDAAARLRRTCASPRALDQFQVMGEIQEGEENAKDGFVVWPAQGDTKEVTLFVTGTSAAFDRVADPQGGKDTIVRRTWVRHYALPGVQAPATSAEASFDTLKDAWIMR
jgi:hypothetical protein